MADQVFDKKENSGIAKLKGDLQGIDSSPDSVTVKKIAGQLVESTFLDEKSPRQNMGLTQSTKSDLHVANHTEAIKQFEVIVAAHFKAREMELKRDLDSVIKRDEEATKKELNSARMPHFQATVSAGKAETAQSSIVIDATSSKLLLENHIQYAGALMESPTVKSNTDLYKQAQLIYFSLTYLRDIENKKNK